MKKLLIIALAVFATTAFAATPGVKKNKKKKKAIPAAVTQPAYPRLLSASDSLSYAAGMFTTRGLMDYVKQHMASTLPTCRHSSKLCARL